MRFLSIALAATTLALGACSPPLTSDHPLFAVADQTGPAPLAEGVWVALSARCTREAALSATPPEDCEQMTLRRADEGAWVISGKDKDENGVERTEELRLVIAPAVHTADADAYAPLYIVQLSAHDADPHSGAPADARIYMAFAPIGAMPARELYFIDVNCDAILREGPIDGVSTERDAQGNLSACRAANQTAVREAAQRATIEELSNIDQTRLLFVHP